MKYETTNIGIRLVLDIEDWNMIKTYEEECKLNLIYQLGIPII